MEEIEEQNNTSLPDFAFLVDTATEFAGKWYDVHTLPGIGSVPGFKRIKVRSTYTKDHQDAVAKARTRAIKEYSAADRVDFLEKEKGKIAIEHCFKDWELVDKHGNEVPFDVDLAYRLCTMEDENGMNPARKFLEVFNTAVAVIQGELSLNIEEDEGN